MEIQIYNPGQGQPLPPVQWNYAEVKQWVTEGLERYKGVVYNETQITAAKKDRAALNKLAQAIDAKRREMKAMYLHPYEEFDAQAKELVGMIKDQSNQIDVQVKAYDETRKKEKLDTIRIIYDSLIGNLAELVPYERLHNPKWLNVTCSMNTIPEEMERTINNISAGLSTIDDLNLDAGMAERVKSVFLRNFDLAAALAEKNRIEQERAALERLRAGVEAASTQRAEKTTPTEDKPTRLTREAHGDNGLTVIDFRVWVTKEQMAALKGFLVNNSIKYGRVPKD